MVFPIDVADEMVSVNRRLSGPGNTVGLCK